MAWILSSLRRLRDERLSAIGLALLVLVTAFLFAATPRLLDRSADETLRATLGAAQPANRNIQFILEDRLEPRLDDALAAVSVAAERADRLLPPDIDALVADRAWTIETARYVLPELEGDAATLRLRIQPDVADRAHLVSGRWPTEATTRVDNPLIKELPPPKVTAFEMALPVASADALRVGLGDTLIVRSDAADPMVGRGHEEWIGATLVGTFDVDDGSDPWWLNGTELMRPTVRAIGDLQIYDATALLAPAAYAAWMNETQPLLLPVRYTFREYLDAGRFDSTAVPVLIDELRRLEAAMSSTRVTINEPVAMRTGLSAILDDYRARWASAATILTVVVIGPAAVAAGALGLVAVLAAQRRRSALALSRGRGASLGQVVAAVAAEGLLLGGPAAALAAGAALALIPADPLAVSVAAGSAVAVAAIVILVLATVPATSGPAFGASRDVAVPRQPSPRRLILEGVVVVLAIAGAALLRERGVRGASSATGLTEADPFLAAVPALIGVAAALVTVRLMPIPMRFMAFLARRRRDLVPVLAMRRATRGRAGSPAFVVLLTTAAIGAFSSAVLVHLDRAADVVAWAEVGADYRIGSRASSVNLAFDPAAIPGVQAAAVAWSGGVNIGPANLRSRVVALGAADYDEVVTGTPADPSLPIDLFAESPPVIPLVVSRALAERPDGVAVGSEFPLAIQAYTFQARVVAVRDSLTAFASEDLVVIVSLDQIQARFPTARLIPTIVYLRGPASAEPAIRSAVAEQLPPGTILDSRRATSDALRSSPSSRAVASWIALAAIVAFGYAALAVAAALALAGAARAVEIAHLRALGLTDRQAAGLVILEHSPIVGLAFIAGTALGLGVYVVLRDGLGLEQLVGSRVVVPTTIEPIQIALVLGAIVSVVGLGLVLGTLMQRGAAPVAAVRRGFE